MKYTPNLNKIICHDNIWCFAAMHMLLMDCYASGKKVRIRKSVYKKK